MPDPSPPLPAAFLTIPLAHRGLHDRAARIVENSRAAVTAALAAGYGIEIDIQRAACGEAMVFHDDGLGRLTAARGGVADHTAADLARLTLRGTAETIPTLAEILALVAGRTPLLVEIKDQDGALGPAVGRLEARVAELVRDYAGPVAVMSFNPHAVAAFADAAPGAPRGLTTCAFAGDEWGITPERRAELAAIADADRLGIAFVSHDRTDLGSPALARLRSRGLPVLCWTVRSAADAALARRVADNITFEGYRPDA